MSISLDEVVAQAVAQALGSDLGQQLSAIRAALDRIERSQPTRFLTVAEAATVIGCHQCTVRRMLESGQLAYKRIGKDGRGVRIDSRSLTSAGGEGK